MKKNLPRPVTFVVASLLGIASVAPCLTVLTFFFFGQAVRANIGHWPQPMVETVEMPYLGVWETATAICFLTQLVGSILWYPLLCLARFSAVSKSYVLTCMELYPAAWFVCITSLFLDKHTFFAWWID